MGIKKVEVELSHQQGTNGKAEGPVQNNFGILKINQGIHFFVQEDIARMSKMKLGFIGSIYKKLGQKTTCLLQRYMCKNQFMKTCTPIVKHQLDKEYEA